MTATENAVKQPQPEFLTTVGVLQPEETRYVIRQGKTEMRMSKRQAQVLASHIFYTIPLQEEE